MTIAKTVMTFFILCTFFVTFFKLCVWRTLRILLTDCMTTSALNEQFIANLVLLRCHPSENASVIEYANSEDAQFEKETFYLFIFSQIIGIKYITDWCTG